MNFYFVSWNNFIKIGYDWWGRCWWRRTNKLWRVLQHDVKTLTVPAGRELSVRAETFFESNAHHEQILFMPHKNILHVTCRWKEANTFWRWDYFWNLFMMFNCLYFLHVIYVLIFQLLSLLYWALLHMTGCCFPCSKL